MDNEPTPSLRLLVDKAALADNWRALDRLSGDAQAGAAVKADCYGLGVGQCLPALLEAGAREFYVAHWAEVGEVANYANPGNIRVLHGPLTAQDANFAKESGVIPVINSLQQARLWLDHGGGRCDLMIDTGINRLGLEMENLADPLIAQLEVDILMSHLACADEDVEMNRRQLARFKETLPMIAHRRASLCNSAAIALGRDYTFDLTRPGLSIYGGIPRDELAGYIRQVAQPQAAIIQCRDLRAGDSVGYNALFTADGDMRIGIVSIGYADGILNCRGAAGDLPTGNAPARYLQADGAILPILGKISMDMIAIDLANAPQLREGDWVEVPYDLPDVARQTPLSQYELLTILGNRLKHNQV